MDSVNRVTKDIKIFNRKFIASIITGQVAGLIMAIVVMIVFAIFLGKGPFFPVQVIGSTLLGASALEGFHLGALLTGLILHQAGPSLLWGVVFGLFSRRLSFSSYGKSLLLGLVVGVVSMIGPYFLIPLVMRTFHGIDFWNQEVPIVWDWAAHVVFGISFVLYPIILKKIKNN